MELAAFLAFLVPLCRKVSNLSLFGMSLISLLDLGLFAGPAFKSLLATCSVLKSLATQIPARF